MSPDEQELLASFAQVAFFNTVNSIVTITGYGAFVLGSVVAILSLLRRYSLRHSPTSRGLLICLIVIFICFTWDVFYSGGFNLDDIDYTFVRILPGGLVAQAESADNHTTTWQYMPSWAATINLLLSDCIVAWRAWILFQQEKFWRLALVALMVANIGVNIADCIWGDIELQVEVVGSTTLDWLSSTLSLAVNLCATFLIALKAWNHHRFLTDAFLHKKTRAQRVLLLLVESGAVYCAIQSVYEIFILLDIYTVVDTGFSQAMNVITAMSIVVAACYPIAVIILIHKDISPIVELETATFNRTKVNFGTTQVFPSDAPTVVVQGEYEATA
ncbi:hypothetical protein FB446DRAFT_129463 [Lentinula raphanica]|nr:hypothetical protein FB446DRAFT_129463 [Lentinula raphanica]